jgi:hypothetical protein
MGGTVEILFCIRKEDIGIYITMDHKKNHQEYTRECHYYFFPD